MSKRAALLIATILVTSFIFDTINFHEQRRGAPDPPAPTWFVYGLLLSALVWWCDRRSRRRRLDRDS
jgi:hypothetical protein